MASMAMTRRGALKEIADGVEALDKAAGSFKQAAEVVKMMDKYKPKGWDDALFALAANFSGASKALKTAAVGLKASYLLHRNTLKSLKKPTAEY